MDANGVIPSACVVITGDRIWGVLEAPCDPRAGVAVFLLDGRFVIPGLVDSHAHLSYSGATIWAGDFVPDNLRATLYMGVTTVVDAGGPLFLLSLRDRIEKGEILGPHLMVTGPFLTEELSHPCEYYYDEDVCWFIHDEEEAGSLVESLLSEGVDGIKMVIADGGFEGVPEMPSVSEEEATYAVHAAGKTPVMAHVDESSDIEKALAAGVAIMAHPSFGDEMPEDLALKVESSHSTITAFENVTRLLDGRIDVSDPEILAVVPEAVLINWCYLQEHPETLGEWPESAEVWRENAMRSIRRLKEAGARVVAGSDAGYYFIPHGLGLHRELENLVEAGWSEMEALSAATIEAARVFGLDGEIGTVESGKRADLLVLSSSPLEAISNTKEIEMVILSGEILEREALALSSGEMDVVLVADSQKEGGPCIIHEDCESGLSCDLYEHRCVPPCATPGDVTLCNEESYCSSDDALYGSEGVCREGDPCDLYEQDCEPESYSYNW